MSQPSVPKDRRTFTPQFTIVNQHVFDSLPTLADSRTNQLFDVEIDKVNKPYLPLASGDFSMGTGLGIVAACTALSLIGGWLSGSVALMATLVISFVLGIVYSSDLPLMRWKRSPVLAAGIFNLCWVP